MNKKYKIILSVLGVVASIIALVWFMNYGIESTDDATIEAHIIPISSKIPGYLVKLNVADNIFVKKGDIVAEIDATDYNLRLKTAEATLTAAKVMAKNAAINAKRQIAIGKAAGTQKSIDDATAEAELKEAELASAMANLELAKQELADTKIIAPEDGYVTMRTAEQGAFMRTGQQMFVLVNNKRWVIANFKEVQITHMKKGNKVKLEIDAYPDLKAEGVIDSIQVGTGGRFSAFPPENATGNFVKIVQRVPVKITFTSKISDEIILGPGMSVVPTVYLESQVK